jgi:hypothetical protein
MQQLTTTRHNQPYCKALIKHPKFSLQQQHQQQPGTHLELVSQASQCGLELGDGGVVELLLPVEAGAAVVGQQLAGVLLMDGCGKGSRLLKAGLASLGV